MPKIKSKKRNKVNASPANKDQVETNKLGTVAADVPVIVPLQQRNFVFFYGKESPFSQFHPAKFVVDDITYSCAEQYMMHQKAGRHIVINLGASNINVIYSLACFLN